MTRVTLEGLVKRHDLARRAVQRDLLRLERLLAGTLQMDRHGSAVVDDTHLLGPVRHPRKGSAERIRNDDPRYLVSRKACTVRRPGDVPLEEEATRR